MALPRRNIFERLGGRVASALCALPEPVQIALSGGRVTVIDGHTLAPDVQLLLYLDALRGQPLPTSTDELRAQQRRAAMLVAGRPTPVGEVRELVIDTESGPLGARHYAPERGRENGLDSGVVRSARYAR